MPSSTRLISQNRFGNRKQKPRGWANRRHSPNGPPLTSSDVTADGPVQVVDGKLTSRWGGGGASTGSDWTGSGHTSLRPYSQIPAPSARVRVALLRGSTCRDVSLIMMLQTQTDPQ
jgi:hypothetical protein